MKTTILNANKVGFSMDINLNPRQVKTFLSLKDEADRLTYLLSFKGRRGRVNLNRFGRGSDSLSGNKNKFLHQFFNRCNTTSAKSPTSNKFHFGIEIECIIPYGNEFTRGQSTTECSTCEGSGTLYYRHRDSGHEIEDDCPDCDGIGEVDSDDYNEDTALDELANYLKKKGIKGLHVQSDGSLDPEDSSENFTAEISCLTSDFKNLEQLCKALAEVGAFVNTSCGLHVHLDMRGKYDDQLSIIKQNFENSLDVLFSLVPESRRGNSYCRKQVSTDKYSALNTGTLTKYKTFECRLHSGSVSFEKIKNWCEVLKAIVDAKDTYFISDLKAFQKYFNLSEKLINWTDERYAKFNNTQILTEEAS